MRDCTPRTWTHADVAQLHAVQRRHGQANVPDGWLVRVEVGSGYSPPVAAGPVAREALALARELGIKGDVRKAWPATAAELDALDLPPSALGIEDGAEGAPWWREPASAPAPPDGPPDRSVYDVVEAGGEP